MPSLNITKTYLSTKPAKHAFWIALWSALLLSIVAMVHWEDAFGLAEGMPANAQLVFKKHQLWRLFTTMGVHADFKHLASNLVFFVILTYLLSAYFGLLVYPLLTIICGAAVNAIVLQAYPPDVFLIGVSGAVYFMAGFWLASFVLIERTQSVGNRFLRCVGFVLVLLIPDSFDPAVSYLSHAVGFTVGVSAAVPWFLARKTWLRSFEVLAQDDGPLTVESADPPADPGGSA